MPPCQWPTRCDAHSGPRCFSRQRAWTRFSAHGLAEYTVLPSLGGETKQAEITNISASGIGLILKEKIEPGAILDLILKTKDGGPTFEILACIVFLGDNPGGTWLAGCHFIRELEERDLPADRTAAIVFA
ncbi:MAG: PilZ domain-containing protein [Planctomycetes bacterium]|nr:PilZ domain-containing protein [Planctomycetota bacterium]